MTKDSTHMSFLFSDPQPSVNQNPNPMEHDHASTWCMILRLGSSAAVCVSGERVSYANVLQVGSKCHCLEYRTVIFLLATVAVRPQTTWIQFKHAKCSQTTTITKSVFTTGNCNVRDISGPQHPLGMAIAANHVSHGA